MKYQSELSRILLAALIVLTPLVCVIPPAVAQGATGEPPIEKPTGEWRSPPLSGYGHHPSNPKDNFLCPRVRTIMTTSLDGVSAKMVIDKDVFMGDGCVLKGPANTATLQVFRNSKPVLQKTFRGVQYITGPDLVPNIKKPPTVSIDVCDPREEYMNYDYDPRLGRYKKTDNSSTEPKRDDARDIPPTEAVRHVVRGDWSATLKWRAAFSNLDNGGQNFVLSIKNGKKQIYAAPVVVQDIGGKRDDSSSIEVYGPVIISLDGGKNPQVLLRYKVGFITAEGEELFHKYELIYYWDEPSATVKLVQHCWGQEDPHLADHERDGKIEFITQDAEFARALWDYKGAVLKFGSGGPMQIWQWRNNSLANVTRQYPWDLKRHARSALHQFKEEPDHNECYLLGYIADLCSLGQREKALAELERLKTPNTVQEKERIIEQLKKCGYL